MFSGDELFINNGNTTKDSMLGFWQWTLSCIHDSSTRGSFAEYIVKLALDHGGFSYNPEGKTGMEMFDLLGPVIPSTNKKSRIEVKSTGYFRLIPNAGYSAIATQQFNIAKKVPPDETGAYQEGTPKQRNNDIYVFVVYNGKTEEDNIFDLSLWDFYVLPTFKLNEDQYYKDRTYIKLSAVSERSEKLTFDELSPAIAEACKSIR